MSECYIGEIRIWAGVRIPENWMLCNGQSVSISEYEPLYALIGTTYGGDGRTNFNLPNLQGMLPIGQGQGVGLSNRVLGQIVGAETVTLVTSQMPAHNHPLQGTTAAATTTEPSDTTVYATTASNFYSNIAPTPTNLTALNDVAVSPYGPANTVPHDNIMPVTAINYIIATLGNFPQPQS
jgi:microcystin-dependent protein